MISHRASLALNNMAVDFETSISTVSIVLFIAAGALFFFLAFILAKRQIMRFASKSSCHPIGAGAPKHLKKGIFEKLEMTKTVGFEPPLLSPTLLQTASTVPNHYLYRMRAMDAFSKFDEIVKSEYSGCEKRHPNQPMRSYLIGIHHKMLNSISIEVVRQFCDIYEHARHDPSEFGELQYNAYIDLFEKIIKSLETGISKQNSESALGASPVDIQVIYSPDLKVTNTKTYVADKKNNTAIKHPGDLRFRSRMDSSGHSSLLDSGHSSQPSSELTEKGSSEKIALVELSKKGEFV